jgi:hypothetical protein
MGWSCSIFPFFVLFLVICSHHCHTADESSTRSVTPGHGGSTNDKPSYKREGPQPQHPAVDLDLLLADRRPRAPVPPHQPIAAAHADKRFPRAGPGRAVVYGRAAIAGRRPLLCCAPGETRFGMLVIPWAPLPLISGCLRHVWRSNNIQVNAWGPH